MFTTGSKLFFGATALSVAGAIVFAITTGGPTGLMGTIGLLSLACVFGFLGGINFFNRDGNVPAMQQGVQYTAAAAQPGRAVDAVPLRPCPPRRAAAARGAGQRRGRAATRGARLVRHIAGAGQSPCPARRHEFCTVRLAMGITHPNG